MGKKSAARRKLDGRPALWQMGLFIILGGCLASVFSPMLMQALPPPANREEAMGRAFGGGLVTVLCIIAGVVMIIMHFVRRRS